MASFERGLQLVLAELKISYVLKDKQVDALRNICSRTEDNPHHTFCLLPTGYGKSDVFALSPLILDKMYPNVNHKCVAVMPLRALVLDQCTRWTKRGIVSQSLSHEDPTNKDVSEGKWTLLFTTPEALDQKKNKDILKKFRKQISLTALDEVHCLVDWGTTFRPAYKKVTCLKALLPDSTIVMSTATATPTMLDQIMSILLLDEDDITWVAAVPDRPNIKLEIERQKASDEDLCWLMERLKGGVTCPKTIIFVRSRQHMRDLFATFTEYLGDDYWASDGGRPGDCLVEMFYGQLDDDSQAELPVAFQQSDSSCRCLISTIAFGLGMQIDDVEYVIHWGPSCNLLQYWQEVGRAGRDGRKSKAIMYLPPYSTDSRRVDEKMIETVRQFKPNE